MLAAKSTPLESGRRGLPVLLALCAFALAPPATASVTAIFNAYRNVGPDGIAYGGVNGDEAHARVYGLTGTGTYYAGSAFVDVHTGVSIGPGCPSCGVSRPSDRSETLASVAADIGQLRGWTFASATENEPGTALGSGSLDVSSSAVFGFTDMLSVRGGSLDLALNMHSSFDASAPAYSVDASYHRSAGTALGVELLLRSWLCTPADGCQWETLGRIGFAGAAQSYDGDGSSGHLWEVGNEVFTSTADSVNETRTLHVGNLADGDYLLEVDATLGSYAFGRASAAADFSSTGYIGVFGDYSSANGYRYLGEARPGTEPALPAPPSLGLALMALGLLRRQRAP